MFFGPRVPPRWANHEDRPNVTQGIPGADSANSALEIIGGGFWVVQGSCDSVGSEIGKKGVFWGFICRLLGLRAP